MKTKLIQKIKEELNRHLEAFEFRFSKEKVLFKKSVVKRMIKVSGEELIKLSEKAISQSKEELVEEVKDKLVFTKERVFWRANEKIKGLSLREMYDAKTVDDILEKLSNK